MEKTSIKLLFDKVLVTANKLVSNKTEGGIIIPESEQTTLYYDEQTVISVGSGIDPEWLKPGDTVVIQTKNFMKPKLDKSNPDNYLETMTFVLPLEEIEGQEYMLIGLRDIKYIKG